MPPTPNLIGKKFGRWTVVKKAKGHKPNNQTEWYCRCECGNTGHISTGTLNSGHSKSCGCLKRDLIKQELREDSRGWKGGRIIDDGGYVQIYDPDHLRAKTNGYVREHLVVMERKIKRRLVPGETVHHKNGIRSDNRSSNLELWCNSHPPGQKVKDLARWAKEIIERYGN